MSNIIHKERIYLHAPAANIVLAFTIQGAVDTSVLKQAILTAYARHEILSCRIIQNGDGTAYYQHLEPDVPSVEMLEGINWQDVLHRQEKQPFLIDQGEWMRHVLIKHQDSVEWVMVAHHLAGDGISMLYFARDVLTAIQANGKGDMPMLPLRLFQADDMPRHAKLNPFIGLMVRMLSRRWDKSKKVFSWQDRIRLHDTFWAKRNTEILSKDINGEALLHLLDICRAHRVTLTAAMVTALLISTPDESDVGLAVSVRPQGFEGMGNYASGFSIQYNPDTQKDFWANAQKVHERMLEKLNHHGKKFFLLNFMNAISPTLIDAAYYSAFDGFSDSSAARMSQMFGYQGNGKGISLTNLTRAPIPDQYGSISLRRIIFIPPLVPNAKRILGVVTVGDCMTITMQYCIDFEKNQAIFQKAVKLLITL